MFPNYQQIVPLILSSGVVLNVKVSARMGINILGIVILEGELPL